MQSGPYVKTVYEYLHRKGNEMFKAKKDGDKKVFGCKMITPDELKKFEEVDRYFVDSSGFGTSGGTAITADEFLKQVKAGKYYAIIETGQFQLWVGEYDEQ